MTAFRTWLARAWAFIKAAPWVLLAITIAMALLRAARSREREAESQLRRARSDLDQLGTPDEQRRYVADQNSAINRAHQHIEAAEEARKDARDLADALETDGHPSVAELVRSWNRDQSTK